MNTPQNEKPAPVCRFTKEEIAAACKRVGDHFASPEVQANIKQVLDDATARIKSESK